MGRADQLSDAIVMNRQTEDIVDFRKRQDRVFYIRRKSEIRP